MSPDSEVRHQRLPGILYNVVSLVAGLYYDNNDQYLILYCSLIMSAKRIPNRLLCADSVRKFIGQFSDLTYDSAEVITYIDPLLESRKLHKRRKYKNTQIYKLTSDTIFMLTTCTKPFKLVEKEPFR